VKVSRGDFFTLCGAAILGSRVDASPLLGAVLGSVEPAGIGRSVARFRLQDACAAQFRPHVNSAFSVRPAQGARLPLVLASVIEHSIDNRVQQFSLMFDAPAGAALPDGTHAFQHPALGDFDLFVVPVGGSNAHRTVYEACFSRHVEATEDMPCR
jgi:hypothetical protein